jgi:hypothetical protein
MLDSSISFLFLYPVAGWQDRLRDTRVPFAVPCSMERLRWATPTPGAFSLSNVACHNSTDSLPRLPDRAPRKRPGSSLPAVPVDGALFCRGTGFARGFLVDERPSLFPVWRSRPVQASRLCIGEDTVRFGIDTNGDAGLDASGLDRNKGPLVPDEGKLWPSEDATLIVRCGDATLLVPTACLGLRGGAALENLGEVLSFVPAELPLREPLTLCCFTSLAMDSK